MNKIAPKGQRKIIVNARFLTRRITGLERYAIDISRQLKKIQPSLTFIAPKDVIHQSLAEELGAECFGMSNRASLGTNRVSYATSPQ